MLVKKNAFLILFCLILNSLGFAQNPALSKINTEDLKRHLSFIASDSLQGRKFGTEINGLEITANYLANESRKTGLKPGAENFFQKVNIIAAEPDENRFVQVKNKRSKSIYKSNSIVNLSGSGNANWENEQVILAGFGFKDKSSNYDDLENLDIKGKIVVVAQGNPESFKTGESFRWNSRLERRKIETLASKGPKAILMVTNPQDEQNNTFNQIGRYLNRERYILGTGEDESEEISAFVVLPEFADKLLKSKGKYKKYLNSIVSKNKTNSYLIKGKMLSLNSKKTTSSIEAKNVIAVVEGSDPVLKNEYMVFMAHYDHLGIDGNGEVYNGADDNGSGTVTLLEVAEAFMSLEQKPKRSIVFLWVTAEEVGLLGSQYYTKNPIFPLEKTVACINIDMDGRVYEPRDSVWARSPKQVKDYDGLYTLANQVWPDIKVINSAACNKLGLIPDYSLPSNFLRSSDHYHFHNNGVPILNYATGYHADYHKVGDEVIRINFDKMKRVADLCFLVGYEIANRDEIKFEKKNSAK